MQIMKSRNETIAFHFVLDYSECLLVSHSYTMSHPPLSEPGLTHTTPSNAGTDTDPPCCKGAGRPRAADLEARLQNLLESAASLFMDKGYSNVSLELIAHEAHVAVRTIYVKFGGKAGLFNAVIAGGRSRYFAMGDMDTDGRPIRQILDDFSLRYVKLVSMPQVISLHRMVVAEAKTNPELALTFDRAGPGQTRELLTRFFARPDILAHFRDALQPHVLALHLINCLMGDQLGRLLFEAEKEPSEADLRRNVAQGLDLFFEGTRR